MAAFRSGIHGVNGVKSATSLTYQIFFAGSQRAPSALAASFSANGTFKSILMGKLSVSVEHGDHWRTVGDHRHRQRSRNLPKVAKGNCRKPTQNVETPQNPNRALGRMHTGGVVRHTSEPTIETGACIESLPIAVALMRGGFRQPADLPPHPR